MCHVPGSSAGDLFRMVSSRDLLERLLVTSNQGMKRSRIESPGFDVLMAVKSLFHGRIFH